MNNTILVAGATGNLGGKIVDALLAKNANVKAIVRLQTDVQKIKALEAKGVKVFKVDFKNINQVAKACEGVDCVVSALAGLHETIIETQKALLDGAVIAKVTRFIPSDFSNDFTNLIPGKNRNLDFRRDFHKYLDGSNIKATSIFNGPFMDLLTTKMPLILFKIKRILCWGNPNQIIEFTTTYNVAQFTANAALDPSTPRYLKIAGDTITCNQLVQLLTQLTGKKYKLLKPGGIALLNFVINLTKFINPAKGELYPAWQGMQYMRDMMEGRIIFTTYHNNRYAGISWVSIKDFLISQKVENK